MIMDRIVTYLSKQQQGSRVSSRNVMAQRFKVSRSTIDKVMKELEQKGFVYSIKGSGTFVAMDTPGRFTSDSGEKAKYMWAILQSDMESDLTHDHFAGIKEYAQQKHCQFIVCKTDEQPDTEREYINWLIRSGIDGLIIVPARSDANSIEWYRKLAEEGIPFVFWNRSYDYMPEVPQICYNGYQGGTIGTRHLIERGYRKIAFLAHYRFRSSMDRFFGYCSALAEANMQVDTEYVNLDIGLKAEEMAAAIIHLLSKHPEIDAVLCHSEEIARTLLSLQKQDSSVNQKLGIVTFESVVNRSGEMSQLTRISLNSYESGRRAAECLYRLCIGKANGVQKLHVIEPKLVIGTSTPFIG